MQRLRNRVSARALAIAAVAAPVLVGLAQSAASAGQADAFGVTTQMNDALGILTGPAAKIAIGILVICGIAMIARSHDLGGGFQIAGAVTLGFGLVIAMVTVIGNITAQGASIPNAFVTANPHIAALQRQPARRVALAQDPARRVAF